MSRLTWLIIAVCVLFSTLFFRLFELQVIKGSAYLTQADDNRFYTHHLIAQRGVFLDRYQQPLVWNIPKYFEVSDPTALYQQRQPISRDQALSIIASESADLVVSDNERSYRYPLAMAHVLGYVGEVTAEDLQKDESRSVGQQIGKAGLEYTQEKTLRGRDGQETFEVNATGKRLRKVSEVAAVPGQNVFTSLDPYLSVIAAQAFGEGKGGVIITDAQTGQILSLVSLPSFDPNLLSQTLSDPILEKQRKQQIQQVFNDPKQLFFNRLVAGAYPPGSVFKLVTALSGLSTGHLDTTTTVDDQGVLKVGEYEFGNWYFRQYGRVEGSINLQRAIARSNDIFFYKVAEWVGPDLLAEMARQFGFGQKTGVELPAEAKGLVPEPTWKEKVLHEHWYLGDTYHYGIGQGNLLTTPIQIAQLTQAVGNKGSLCSLSLLKKNEVKCQPLNVKESDLDVVIHGMVDACSPGGTAYPFFPYNGPLVQNGGSGLSLLDAGAVACKTGTAEFGAANEQDYRKTHGWFTAVIDLRNWKQNLASSSANISSASAQVNLTLRGNGTAQLEPSSPQFRLEWLKAIAQSGFPDRIGITVLKESDEQSPYREGSRDAAPIAKQIVDWIIGKEVHKVATAASQPSATPPPGAISE